MCAAHVARRWYAERHGREVGKRVCANAPGAFAACFQPCGPTRARSGRAQTARTPWKTAWAPGPDAHAPASPTRRASVSARQCPSAPQAPRGSAALPLPPSPPRPPLPACLRANHLPRGRRFSARFKWRAPVSTVHARPPRAPCARLPVRRAHHLFDIVVGLHDLFDARHRQLVHAKVGAALDLVHAHRTAPLFVCARA